MRGGRDSGKFMRKYKRLSEPQRLKLQARSRAGRGFSLIEMIGVLAIMGILAGMLAPPLLRQLRQAKSANEDANLEEVARAVAEGIKTTGTFPNPTLGATAAGGWANLASNYTSLGINQLLFVFGTNTSTERRFYLTPGLFTYLNNYGFSTPVGGWSTNSFPPDAQIVLVSSSREDLLLACPTGANLGGNDVAWLKNFVKTPGANGLYAATNLNVVNASWTNRGEFLHVKTIDARPLFCRVDLYDTAGPAEVMLVDGGVGYTSIPSPTNIDGTTINYMTNSSANVLISTVYPAQRRSGLPPGRNTNNILVTTNIAGSATTEGTIRITTPGAPQYGVGGGLTTMTTQSMAFYVLKGTTVSLIAPGISTNSQIIQKDSQYEYFGRSWRQLY